MNLVSSFETLLQQLGFCDDRSHLYQFRHPSDRPDFCLPPEHHPHDLCGRRSGDQTSLSLPPGIRHCLVADGIARAHAVPDRPLRIVAVKPLTGGRKVQAFYSTRHDASAKAVLTWYAMRWSIEEVNQNSKTHLGFEEPQSWSRKAVQRTAPVAMLLYSLIVLWFAGEGHRHYTVLHRPWYRSKSHASFADMLATLRCQCVRQEVLSMGLSGQGSRKVIETLEHVVRQAA